MLEWRLEFAMCAIKCLSSEQKSSALKDDASSTCLWNHRTFHKTLFYAYELRAILEAVSHRRWWLKTAQVGFSEKCFVFQVKRSTVINNKHPIELMLSPCSFCTVWVLLQHFFIPKQFHKILLLLATFIFHPIAWLAFMYISSPHSCIYLPWRMFIKYLGLLSAKYLRRIYLYNLISIYDWFCRCKSNLPYYPSGKDNINWDRYTSYVREIFDYHKYRCL